MNSSPFYYRLTESNLASCVQSPSDIHRDGACGDIIDAQDSPQISIQGCPYDN
jgi:hypothetical protein